MNNMHIYMLPYHYRKIIEASFERNSIHTHFEYSRSKFIKERWEKITPNHSANARSEKSKSHLYHFSQWQRTVYNYKPLDFPSAVAKKDTRSSNERSHERILFALSYERKDSLVIENLMLYRISAHYVKLVIRGVSSIYVYMYSTIYRFASRY